MPLCLCLDKTAVGFVGIFLSLLGTAAMLKGQVNFRQNKDGTLEFKSEDDAKIRNRNQDLYKYGIWLLFVGFIVQLLAVLL